MTERETPIISLQSAQKQYRGNEVVRIESLDLRKNEPVLIWGSNASGKSTLLRMLAGVTSLTQGTRKLDPAFRTACSGFLPQTGGLYEDLSIEQNLLILSRLHKRTPDEAPFSALLDDVVSGDLKRPLGTLSGGMQRIMSIAVMLSLRPALLFLDEPFGGLDPAHRERMRGVLSDLGKTIPVFVVAEHRRNSVGQDWRRLAMTNGRIEETS
ncbi:ATP-binding cassette domain-containing protein [uncultured Ruegeria sp.]|uniref:ATP-binding cassette domain-containing protein n=1 Tax=uncultured Ruegeria sp. TaxID=259304 RepID=UPI00260CCCE7|nr:ATP-binding cassette domain-containing protein [uncultured Ruegeria sp.]